MNTHSTKSNLARWLVVATYAAAMAWVESAVVFYLRTWINRLDPYQPDPLPSVGALGPVELGRELATLIMLLTVGMLAGRTWRTRFAYTAIAFGVWDIFYYLFLKIMCGWPQSLVDWDILFLIPLPWWGPVWAPVSIALLMLVWGTIASRSTDNLTPAPTGTWMTWVLNGVGILLALYVFMVDSLRVADQGVEVIRRVLPVQFNWPLFCLALLLMAAPVLEQLWQLRSQRRWVPDGALAGQ